jgi:transcriptional regulator with XRE-family HTH domain
MARGGGRGELLQRLRQAAGLSQPQLAEAAGVPVATLRDWEQGRRAPPLDTAARVAVALGVSIDELAGAGPAARKGKAKP